MKPASNQDCRTIPPPLKRAEGPAVHPARGNALGNESCHSFFPPTQRANRSPQEPLARWVDEPPRLFSASQGRAITLGALDSSACAEG